MKLVILLLSVNEFLYIAAGSRRVMTSYRENGTSLVQFVTWSWRKTGLSGLNTTSAVVGRGSREGECGCLHLPGRQDGRGLAAWNWRQFQHSESISLPPRLYAVLLHLLFLQLSRQRGKQELYNKHIGLQLLFILSCFSSLSLSLPLSVLPASRAYRFLCQLLFTVV